MLLVIIFAVLAISVSLVNKKSNFLRVASVLCLLISVLILVIQIYIDSTSGC
jgi:lipopolysaccharide export LptBFGC system permease protein LptF